MTRHIYFVFVFSSFFCLGQNYAGYKSWETVFVFVKGDTAFIESYKGNLKASLMRELPKAVLNVVKKGKMSIYKANGNQLKLCSKRAILKKDGKRYKLDTMNVSNREIVVKLAYFTPINNRLMRLADSLDYFRYRKEYSSIMRHLGFDDKLTLNEFYLKTDSLAEEVESQIIEHTDPKLTSFYKELDSLSVLSDSGIYNLLSEAHYKKFSGRKLIYDLSVLKPNVLVDYMNSDPSNESLLLEGLKNHPRNREVTGLIKNNTKKSIGRQLVKKQRRKKIVGEALSISLASVIILTPIAGLLALGFKIF